MSDKPLRVAGECRCDREVPVVARFPSSHPITDNQSRDAVFVRCRECGRAVLCAKQSADDNSGQGGGASA